MIVHLRVSFRLAEFAAGAPNPSHRRFWRRRSKFLRLTFWPAATWTASPPPVSWTTDLVALPTSPSRRPSGALASDECCSLPGVSMRMMKKKRCSVLHGDDGDLSRGESTLFEKKHAAARPILLLNRELSLYNLLSLFILYFLRTHAFFLILMI